MSPTGTSSKAPAAAPADRDSGPPRRRRRWTPRVGLRRLDIYLLGRTLPAMTAVLGSTMVAFLLERLLHSFDLLAQTNRGFHFLIQLAVDLAPHYLGMTLPAGFFIGLFVVVNRLNQDSEIDAILASGISMSRIAVPLVGLGVVLMVLSLLLYGFIQPYSRYAYRAVLHAAENAGWNGEVRPMAVLSPSPDLILTVDNTDATGEQLTRVFIRRLTPAGQEDVLTAASAEVRRNADNRSITLQMRDGLQLSTTPSGSAHVLTFDLFSVPLPLVPTAKYLKARGGEENELTLFELAQRAFGREMPTLPRQALLAELLSRLARALALPLLPLLALPFGLTAKRAGSAPAMTVAAVLLFAFQTSMIFGQGLVASGRTTAAIAIGWPTALFSAACIASFIASRKRPGENPVNQLAERIGDLIAMIRGKTRATARP